MKGHAQSGFTLIEVIIASAVVAILLSLMIPSFGTLTMNERMTTQANDFISTLVLARGQALKRVSRVTVCSSADGVSCSNSGGWEQGWIAFADTNNNAEVNSGQTPPEDILQVYNALDGGNTLRGSSNVASYISYVASGTTQLKSGGLQTGTLALCDDRGVGEHARAINVSVTGRSWVETSEPATCAP
jgi:type IV fimbrial biogenesis protein FimT